MKDIHVLLVEDDIDFGNILKQYLNMEGFLVTIARNGEAGWETFLKASFDVCVLDVMMPKMDGFTLGEKIRQKQHDIPLIFLTAKNQTKDKIKGLKIGADDYITKPFDAEELKLRIKNLLRRAGVGTDSKREMKLGNFTFNQDSYVLSGGSKERFLTEKEALLLEMLAGSPNKVVKRSEILIKVWGEDDYFTSRSLDVFITRLRKYLSEDNQISIKNIRGVGSLLKII